VDRVWLPWGKQRIYRLGGMPAVYWALSSGFLVVVVMLLILAARSPAFLVFLPLNLMLALVTFRMSRMGARLDEDAVTLIHQFRTIRVPWSSFDRFIIRPHSNVEKMGHVRRVDGSLVFIQGLGTNARGLNDDWELEAIVESMNHEARRLKGTSG
jgi:hypothetical protein